MTATTHPFTPRYAVEFASLGPIAVAPAAPAAPRIRGTTPRRTTRRLGPRAVIYSRVSTDAQEREGTSLETQERACQALVNERGWAVVRCIRDAASGSSLERPGIEELRDLLRRGDVDVIVSYAVDRLSRNQNHIGILFDDCPWLLANRPQISAFSSRAAINIGLATVQRMVDVIAGTAPVEHTYEATEAIWIERDSVGPPPARGLLRGFGRRLSR